jgi:hypothetical protein
MAASALPTLHAIRPSPSRPFGGDALDFQSRPVNFEQMTVTPGAYPGGKRRINCSWQRPQIHQELVQSSSAFTRAWRCWRKILMAQEPRGDYVVRRETGAVSSRSFGLPGLAVLGLVASLSSKRTPPARGLLPWTPKD